MAIFKWRVQGCIFFRIFSLFAGKGKIGNQRVTLIILFDTFTQKFIDFPPSANKTQKKRFSEKIYTPGSHLELKTALNIKFIHCTLKLPETIKSKNGKMVTWAIIILPMNARIRKTVVVHLLIV